ncbi:SDR family oxidoreductase [Sphingomonas ginsenosidivorax]|uniref:SDR family oxidoreductase n=1 Tax=Sphingomonas ginsenosidivorax TaxID=862135 RepID=A0A5C6U4Y1_9SPHN|nr:SDR family oxidoreductase [Sphingomonas ginsenosidivorax]TXC67932.1 SDR family oxidoreductase [Sphingomonas ginsenosidivorax]TXC68044.1 SDR family oxidoreductase [Sphingomonas ginsenosidivorax]
MTNKTLDGKIALVTGASGGIGQAIAMHLAKAGAHVMVHYSGNKAAADKTVAVIADNGGNAQSVQADLRDPGAIDALVGQVETLDILVNNAGIADGADILATTRDQYDAVFDTNVKAMFFLTQALLPKMQDGGSIINTSSTVSIAAYPEYIVYAMSKNTVNAFTRSLAAGVAKRQITVNAVLPGATDTDFINSVRDYPGVMEAIAAQTALGRLGKPDDIAPVVTFLASPAGHWITGQCIQANGGMHL